MGICIELTGPSSRCNMPCEQKRVLAPVVCWIIIFAAANFIKTRRIITIYHRRVAGAHLEQHGLRIPLSGLVDQKLDKAPAYPLALIRLSDRQVEDVTFAGGDADDRMADEALLL